MKALVVLLLLATAIKLCVLVAPRADLYGRLPDGSGRSYMAEELHRGTAAVEFLDGPILPILDYQHAPFFGGSVVVAALATPLFAWFGPSISVLKLTGLLFNAVALIFLFLILDRFVSRRAAVFGGLCFALAPPGYTVLSITAYGTHVESNAFAMALVYFFLRSYAGGGPARPRHAFGLGVLAGFALYFGYIVAIVLALFVLVRARADGRFPLRRDVPWTLGGLVVGLAPWLVYNARHGFEGLEIYGRSLGGEGAAAAAGPDRVERVTSFLAHEFPRSFFFEDLGPVPGGVLELFFAVSCGLLWVTVIANLLGSHSAEVSGRGRTLRVLAVLYPLAWLAAFGFTSFRVGAQPDLVVSYRYAYTLWPFLALATGIAFDAWSTSRPGRTLAAAHAFCLVACAVLGALALADSERIGADWHTPAYSHTGLGRLFALQMTNRPEDLGRAIELAEERREPETLDRILFGLGMHLQQSLRLLDGNLRPKMRERVEASADLQHYLAGKVPEPYRVYFAPHAEGARYYGIHDYDGYWRDRGGRVLEEPESE